MTLPYGRSHKSPSRRRRPHPITKIRLPTLPIPTYRPLRTNVNHSRAKPIPSSHLNRTTHRRSQIRLTPKALPTTQITTPMNIHTIQNRNSSRSAQHGTQMLPLRHNHEIQGILSRIQKRRNIRQATSHVQINLSPRTRSFNGNNTQAQRFSSSNLMTNLTRLPNHMTPINTMIRRPHTKPSTRHSRPHSIPKRVLT